METDETTVRGRAEFSLKEFVDVIWQGRWIILPVTLMTTLAAGVAAWIVPKTYEAGIVISPTSETPGGQMSGSGGLSQVAGLASLVGLSTGNDSKKSESLAVLQSLALTEKYIKDDNLLPILFASKWDKATSKWRTTDPEKMPTLWKANELFRDNVRAVVTNPKSGLVTLKITWRDPFLAAKWANEIVAMANDYLRANAITQSERNIAFLGQEAAKTDVVGVKQVIYEILQSEISKEMLARGTEEYAFRILDRALPPERAASPRKLLWVAGGFFAGLALSILWVLVRGTRLK
jgi:uncharacterized protein involved in exopolysaccharide biosynthesis